jgi:hypothetical protein
MGKFGIGGTNNSAALNIDTDSTTSTGLGVRIIQEIQSGSTLYRGVSAGATTAAASFTIPTVGIFVAEMSTIGAGSAITTLYGYQAIATIGSAGAGTAYGYFTNINTSGSGNTNWAYYSQGTANNAFAGNTRFGGVTAPVSTVDVTGSIAATTTILSSGATSGVGYSTGAGGTVTQGTSRTTGVTINKMCGKITLFSSTTTAGTFSSFTVTNSVVDATDAVIVNISSGATVDRYGVSVTAVAAGSFRIQIHNIAAVTPAEIPVLNFAVIKAVSA